MLGFSKDIGGFSMKTKLTSIASVAALLIAFLVPAQPALSNVTVTKTVTVTKSNGQPYVQARVAMLTATDNGVIVRDGDLVLTDGSGQAQLTVPADPQDGFHMIISVQPPVGDLSHAMGTIDGVQDEELYDQNQTFAIQLELADTLVSVKDADGVLAPAGTSMMIFDSNNQFTWWGSTLSSGTLGLNLGSLDSANGPFTLQVQTSSIATSFRQIYEIDVDGPPSILLNGEEVARVEDVYQLQLLKKNLPLTIVDQNSNPISNAFVNIFDHNFNIVSDSISQAGSAGSHIPGAGEYTIEIYRPWDAVDSDLIMTKFDLVASGTYPNFSYEVFAEGSDTPLTQAQNGSFQLQMQLANVEVDVRTPGGELFQGSEDLQSMLDGELQVKINGQWEQAGWLDRDGSRVIGRITEAGTYRVRINALHDPSVAQVITPEFTVAAPIPSTGFVHSSEATLSQPNFLFKVTYEDTVVNEANVRFEPQSQYDYLNWVRSSRNTGVGAYRFSEGGTYRITVSSDGAPSGASETAYIATVNFVNNQAVVTIPGLTAVDGVFELPLEGANLNVRPIDGDGNLVNTSYLNIREVTQNGERHITGQGARDGLISLGVPQGNYVFDLDPGHDNYLLAPRKFKLVVAEDTSDLFVADFSTPNVEISPDDGSGHYTLGLSASNVIGRVVQMDGGVATAIGSGQGRWVDVELQRLVNGNWDWVGLHRQANSDGMFGFRVTEPGTYRVKINPQGFEGVSATTIELDELALTSAELEELTDLGDVALSDPSLTVSVSYQDELIRHAGLEIRQGNDFIDWANTGPSGQAGIAVSEPGSYQLVVHPPYELRSEASRKTYDFVVDEDLVGTVTGATELDGIFQLTLSTPSLIGQVLDPDGNQGVRDAQVVAVDQATNETLWHFGANTDEFGYWSMSLPEGNYKIYARAPWGSIEYGDGPRSGVVTIDANGNVAVPSGQNAEEFDLRLGSPTFSGVVVEPGTTTRMNNVQVCLIPNQTDNNWYCSGTNDLGEWALTVPESFTDFDEFSELVISEWGQRRFAETRIKGAALETLLTNGTYVSGQTYTNISVSPASPNLMITVNAGATKANRVWVSVDRPNVGWIGGSETDSNGVARIYVPENLQGAINVQVNVENNSAVSANYASTRVELAATGSSETTRNVTIDLDEPNLRGKVTTPGDSPVAVRNAWIEIFNDDTGDWYGGAGTNASGEFSIALPVPNTGEVNYRLAVNPPWNFAGSLAKKTYALTIDSAENLTITGVTADLDGQYALSLATPSVVGVVKDSNGNLVRDSWVAPLDNASPAFPEYRWEYGVHSKENGNFSMALPDGSYLLEANPAWNSSGSSKSARCAIVVSGGAMNQSAPCFDEINSRVELTLRAPNVRFKLTDADGNGVAFANVGVGFGSWHTWTQSDRNGNVALYIDAEELAILNPDLPDETEISPYMWFDPPYGSSDLVRWECRVGDAKPICEDLDAIVLGETNEQYIPAPGLDLGSVAFPEPNTKIRVTNPEGDEFVPNAWVGLLIDLSAEGTCSGNRSWVGGANTDENGWAAFNVENLNAKYCIEVNAPWNQRDEFAPKTHSALNQASMNNQSYALAAPNLAVQLLQATDPVRGAKWSWIGVEEVVFDAGNSRYNFLSWITGVGTDNQGNVSLALPEPVSGTKLYRLTGHPGGGIVGARVTCIVAVDSAGLVSKEDGQCLDGSSIVDGAMSLSLSAGNVTGTVFAGGSAVAGAIVAAVNDAGEKITTVTNGQGVYKLELTEGVEWTIKVFTVSRPGDLVEYSPYLEGTTVTPTEPTTVSQINLTVAP